jgi:nitrogen fixation NifU-like protein
MECTSHEDFSSTARDHAQNPRNFGVLSFFNAFAYITGPCGDTMAFWLCVHDGVVERVSFVTDGCGSSLACGSMTACLAEGRRIEEAAALEQRDVLEALGGLPRELEHCALLAASTLKAACADYLEAPQTTPDKEKPADDSPGGTN